MASAQVVETSVANNSPSQDSNHPDDLFQSRLTTDVKQMLFFFGQGICGGVVQGSGRQKIGVAINFVAFCCLGLPL